MPIWQKDDFVRFLDTVYATQNGNSAREFKFFVLLFRAFLGLQLQVTFQQDQKFREVC